jgi:DNA-binding IclR family transcriptional regulator
MNVYSFDMKGDCMDVHKIVEVLRGLETKWKESPSVEDIAEQANCSVGTAHKYLKQAVEQGLIVQSKSGKFMTHEVARAYEKGK